MTDLHTAAKLALEALEFNCITPEDGEDLTPAKIKKAITALREALAEQPAQEPVAWMYDWYAEDEDLDGNPTGGIVNDWISKDYDEAHSPTMGCHNIRPLYTHPEREPEQPAQQEPKQSDIFCGVDFADGLLSVSVLRRRADDVAELLHAEQIELQPQRTWVGLSDEEREIASWKDGSFGAGARWAESKLKEKNTNQTNKDQS